MRSKLLAMMLGTLAIAVGGFWPAPGAPAQAASGVQATLSFQTPTLAANLSGQSPLVFGIRVLGAPVGTTVSTQLYNRLTTRSGLIAALSSTGPSQLLDQSDPLAISCLPASVHGGSNLTLDVVTTASTPATVPGGCVGSAHAPVLDLHCQVGSGSCNGVYPMSLTLTSGTTVLSRLVTLVTFAERPAQVPLRVSTVVRLSSTSTESATDVGSAAHALAHSPTVPIDLSVDPTVVQSLDGTAAGHQALVALASAVSSSVPTREVLRSPYVPLDPGVLASSGLGSEIERQLRRGSQVLTGAGLSPTSSTIWMATSPVTASTTPALAAVGITKLLAPDSVLAEPTATSLSWGQPFVATPGTSSVTTMTIDSVLLGQALNRSDGVLGAMRLLGDLSFLHFERPSLSTPQGVVLELDPATSAAALLPTVLEGLTNNPILEPITVAGLFAQVPVGGNGAPSTRKLAQSGPSTPWPLLQQSALAIETQRHTAFYTSLEPRNPLISTLEDGLLATESGLLSTTGRTAAIRSATAALDSQLSGIAISGADITMTALRSSVPITLTSTTGYQVTGILTLTSGHLTFTKGSRFVEVLDRPTKSLRIPVQAITTGDLPMSATLSTPGGALVLAHQRILVHATHTSIVAIILTIGSAVVLFAWWFRTWWRKPRRRAHA